MTVFSQCESHVCAFLYIWNLQEKSGDTKGNTEGNASQTLGSIVGGESNELLLARISGAT